MFHLNDRILSYHSSCFYLDNNTKFYVNPEQNVTTGRMTVSLESVTYIDKYIVMDKRHVYLGTPHCRNEQFEIVVFQYSTHIALKNARGCFIGFNENGTLLPPCTLTSQDPQTRLFIAIL